MSRVIATTLVAAVALPAFAPRDARAAKRLRPTDVPATSVVTEMAPNPLKAYDDYATPARSFSSRSRLDEREPAFLPALLSRFARAPFAGEGEHAVAVTYERVAGEPFAAAFHSFALAAVADYGDRLRPFQTLTSRGGYRSSVQAMAIHYLRLKPTPGTVTVTFSRRTRAAGAALVYQWESETPGTPNATRRIGGRAADESRSITFTIPPSLAHSRRFAEPLVVVTNGGAAGRVAYRVAVR
jgi:hypothetical protein